MKGYLERLTSKPLTQTIPVSENLGIIVVIPCYNEPDILTTLNSLRSCNLPDCGTEVFLLVNSLAGTEETIRCVNRRSYQECLDYAAVNNTEHLKFIPFLEENLPGKQSGAGLPRKIGMDEAVRRFERINRKEGIIVGLDADCTVSQNYLTGIYQQFKTEKLCSATLDFHHPVDHLPVEDPLRRATEQYELYLRYYRMALEYCGYPYPYFTIGSAMAVTAEVYVRAGGMGKQQAGEDFYFLQKVFPLGKSKFIDTVCVYPTARFSDRVPFGTGPELAKMVQSGSITKKTYRWEAFELLKQLFDRIPLFFKGSPDRIDSIVNDLPALLQAFLREDHFEEKLMEINHHTGSPEAFRKRFFLYFNAFKILKFLNFVHPDPFEPEDVQSLYDKGLQAFEKQ